MRERGSIWRKADLHVHTPASFKWNGGKQFRHISSREEVDKAAEEICLALGNADADIFAIVDYWTFDGFKRLRRLPNSEALLKGTLLLPGIELRVEAPTDYRLNLQIIFSPHLADDRLDEFLSSLDLPTINRPPSDNAFVQLARTLDAGKLATHGASSSDHEDQDKMRLIGAEVATVTRESLKRALTRFDRDEFLTVVPYSTYNGLEGLAWAKHAQADQEFFRLADAFEDRKRQNFDLFHGITTEANKSFIDSFLSNMGGHPKPAICGSDAHKPAEYAVFPGEKTFWIKADASFRGVLQILRQPADRTHLGPSLPPLLDRLEANKGKFVDTVSIQRIGDAAPHARWFDATTIPLNPGLVAVIGNRGSGKSALLDIIALATNAECGRLEFLSRERFLRPPNYGQHFTVDLNWSDGTASTKQLDASLDATAPRRARYLQQSHIETLCNEISKGTTSRFESEIRKVIFAHIPKGTRLDATSLDELIALTTQPSHDALARLRGELAGVVSQLLDVDAQLTAEYGEQLDREYEVKREELWSLKHPRRPRLPDYSERSAASRRARVVQRHNHRSSELRAKIEAVQEDERQAQLRQATAKRLVGRLAEFREQFSAFVTSMKEELDTLRIDPKQVIDLEVHIDPLKNAHDDAFSEVTACRRQLNPTEPRSLVSRLASKERRLEVLRSALARPEREHQEYLQRVKKWKERRNQVLGDRHSPDSLVYLACRRFQIARELPQKRETLSAKRDELAVAIFERLQQVAEVYRDVFKPVQDLVTSEAWSSDVLTLEFAASIRPEEFTDSFLGFLNQARSGSFYNTSEARDLLRRTLKGADFNTADGALTFIRTIEHLLSHDERNDGRPTDISKQVRDSVSVSELITFLYGQSWLSPHYTLRLDGKDVEMLSPGEKGALLIAFYLLLDPDDTPLLIDQPEHNLDNESVYEFLVPCFKAASRRRQVIMVTHNPNLAVVCDADQIVHCHFDRDNGNKITYSSGSIENAKMNERIVDVLEGTWPAFRVRERTYWDSTR